MKMRCEGRLSHFYINQMPHVYKEISGFWATSFIYLHRWPDFGQKISSQSKYIILGYLFRTVIRIVQI